VRETADHARRARRYTNIMDADGPPDPARALPAGFRWGAAVSAYQIEGAVAEDGRGESIWDRFCSVPGNIRDGDTGARACDSYHRHSEDVRLARELGLDAYRFSIAWPRILPQGRGQPNAAGLDFYDGFVDELLDAGIDPFVTLYHWDLPQALEDRGGWPARETAEAFAEYVEVVAARLGDRVRNWITVCEPWVVAWLGYGLGLHAPGRTSEADALAAAHHVLLAHGLAVDVLRRTGQDASVGITIDLQAIHPHTGSEADRAAALVEDGSRNRWILDPVLRGAYPADLAERFAPVLPAMADGDLRTIAAPLDFLGVNYYARTVVRAGPSGGPEPVLVPGRERTQMGWEIYPEGLLELVGRLHDEYAPLPLYVTENGAAYPDRLVDGVVEDPARISYVERHLDALARAAEQGIDVRGYFLWSLLDNFEWAFGYSRRFGIVHVDFETFERLPKASYRWYRDVVAQHRAAAPGGERVLSV
jgi:beta-glucosidase